MRDFDQLDLDAVERVMRNELRVLGARHGSDDATGAAWRAAESALALAYGMAYLHDCDGENAREVYGLACERMDPSVPAEPGLGCATDEWTCGRVLAVAAQSHAMADLDLAMDRFDERAVEGLGDVLEEMPDVGKLDAARLAGVDMDLRPEGAGCVSPSFVRDMAGDMDHLDSDGIPVGKTAADLLSPAQLAQIAESYNASVASVEPGYDDRQDIRGRILDGFGARVMTRSEAR